MAPSTINKFYRRITELYHGTRISTHSNGWSKKYLQQCWTQNIWHLVEGWFYKYISVEVMNTMFQCTRGVSVHSWLGRQLIALKSVSTTGTAAVQPSAATTAVAIPAWSPYLTTCRHQLRTLTTQAVSIIKSNQTALQYFMWMF